VERARRAAQGGVRRAAMTDAAPLPRPPIDRRLAARLVWLVAGVAVLAGVATTGFLRHALRTIDAERARLFEAQSVDSLRINRIEDGISAARNAMKAILDPAAAVAPDALRLDELARWLAGPEGGDPVRGDLEPLLARSTAWRVAYEGNRATLQATHRRIEHAFEGLRAALEAAEGHAALARARSIAQLRRAAGDDAVALARRLLEELDGDPRARGIRIEISELALACERLLWATSDDQLADLLNNRVLGALLRLRPAIRPRGAAAGDAAASLDPDVMNELQTALLGAHHVLDAAHQCIQTDRDSLFGACSRRLVLDAERDALISAVDAAFTRLEEVRGRVIESTAKQASTYQQLAGDALDDAWRSILGVMVGSWLIVGVLTVIVARAIRGQIREIAARNDEIAASREQYRALIETTQAIPWEMDAASGRFVYVGPRARRLLDLELERWLEPGFFPAWLHPEDRAAVLAQYREAAESRSERDLEFRLTRADGRTVWVRSIVSAQRDGERLRGMLLDVTERRQLEFDLQQAQKLESVGRLAAGIAHEINTPIQFVSDSIQFVRESVVDLTLLIGQLRAVRSAVQAGAGAAEAAAAAARTEEQVDLTYLLEHLPKALDRSHDGLERVATIVRSMKAFAHPDQREKAPVDLNQAIVSTLTIARNEYKYVADVETELGDLPPVRCHAGDVNQAILNIVVNAAHAVADVVQESGRKGRIVVRTARDGDEVVVTIRDTGAGIPAAIRHRVFEPFFTTKEIGKGTGQRLAIARSVVVEKHGGELTFETEEGKGTTFFLRLPIDGSRAPLPV